MKNNFLVSLGCLLLLCACEKTENFALPASTIFGGYTEIEPEGLGQFEGSTYTFLSLLSDSTYHLSLVEWTDIRVYGDPCNNITNFYSKGRYSVSRDYISFSGCYTDPLFTSCLARCDGALDFRVVSRFEMTPDELILNPDEDPLIRRVLVSRN